MCVKLAVVYVYKCLADVQKVSMSTVVVEYLLLKMCNYFLCYYFSLYLIYLTYLKLIVKCCCSCFENFVSPLVSTQFYIVQIAYTHFMNLHGLLLCCTVSTFSCSNCFKIQSIRNLSQCYI